MQYSEIQRQSGFKVEAYVIASPSIVTELGIYDRYQTEIQTKGFGRLSDIESHNAAVIGLLSSIDILCETNAVEKISIYDFLAKEKIKDFLFTGEHWNCLSLPSKIITDARTTQLGNKQFLLSCIERGEKVSRKISIELCPFVLEILDKLKKSVKY